MRRAHVLCLAAVLLLSASVNLWHIGFPLGYHIDEPVKIEAIRQGTLNFFHPILMLQVVRLADAVGNIGDGTRTGVDLRGTLPLDFLGIRNADFRFNTIYQQTRVTDPLTGQTRSFSSGDNSNQGPRPGGGGGGPPPLNVGNRDWGYVVSVRQELQPLKSSWSISLARNAVREEFKLTEAIVIDRPVERLDLTWETTAIPGTTLRLGVGNVFSPQEERVRTFFTPDRSSGVISRTESRRNKGGPEGTRSYTIQLSGKF